MKIYIFVTLLLAVLSYLYLKLAIKYKIIDKPNQRSSHSKITVRGGGIIFPIAILLFFFFNNYQYSYFIFGIVSISIISFLDDIYTLSAKIRFPFQLLAVFLTLLQIGLPIDLLLIVYLFFGVGFVNMFNFMDGINGITGMYAIAVLSIFYFININENIIDSNLILYSLISVLIFGFYNFRKKAVFFAGDIGSITLGVLILFLIIFFALELKAPIFILSFVVYGVDATLTLLYRKFFTNESIFDPHRHHIYQKVVDNTKLAHIEVSLIYFTIQVIFNFILFKTYNLSLSVQSVVISVSLIILSAFYIYLFRKFRH